MFKDVTDAVVIPIKKEYKGMKIGVITVWLSFITSQNA
jgi:hypothetical protein